MKIPSILFVLFQLVAAGYVKAQTNEEEAAVQAIIHRLFEGMQKGDSAMVHTVFTRELTMATAFVDKAKNPVLMRESAVKEFLEAVGKPHKEIWYEEIWGLTIKIDGNFAQAWCDYAFYSDNTFSHCGVDAFHLFKGIEGWKIFHLTDTRRKERCTIPETIQRKHRP